MEKKKKEKKNVLNYEVSTKVAGYKDENKRWRWICIRQKEKVRHVVTEKKRPLNL